MSSDLTLKIVARSPVQRNVIGACTTEGVKSIKNILWIIRQSEHNKSEIGLLTW